MSEVKSYAHLLVLDIVQQTQGLGGRVDKTASAGLAGLVFDKQWNFGSVGAGLAECFYQVFPGARIIILEGKFVAVTQRAAGHLVGADLGRKILGFLNEAGGLVADVLVMRGQPAVAKFGFGLDIDIDGGNLQFIFI